MLREGIEDEEGNATRFAWLALAGAEPFPARDADADWKTSILFGRCGRRQARLARALPVRARVPRREPRQDRVAPRPPRLGHYVFLADCEGRDDDEAVADAIAGLGAHCDRVRVLGTYPAAPGPSVS